MTDVHATADDGVAKEVEEEEVVDEVEEEVVDKVEEVEEGAASRGIDVASSFVLFTGFRFFAILALLFRSLIHCSFVLPRLCPCVHLFCCKFVYSLMRVFCF